MHTVVSLAGVTGDGGDQGPEIDLAGVVENEDVPGRRARAGLPDTLGGRDARLETGGVQGAAADTFDVQSSPSANCDEDDPDSSARRRPAGLGPRRPRRGYEQEGAGRFGTAVFRI